MQILFSLEHKLTLQKYESIYRWETFIFNTKTIICSELNYKQKESEIRSPIEASKIYFSPIYLLSRSEFSIKAKVRQKVNTLTVHLTIVNTVWHKYSLRCRGNEHLIRTAAVGQPPDLLTLRNGLIGRRASEVLRKRLAPTWHYQQCKNRNRNWNQNEWNGNRNTIREWSKFTKDIARLV